MQPHAVPHEDAMQAAQDAAMAEINTVSKTCDMQLQAVPPDHAVLAAQDAAQEVLPLIVRTIHGQCIPVDVAASDTIEHTDDSAAYAWN